MESAKYGKQDKDLSTVNGSLQTTFSEHIKKI